MIITLTMANTPVATKTAAPTGKITTPIRKLPHRPPPALGPTGTSPRSASGSPTAARDRMAPRAAACRRPFTVRPCYDLPAPPPAAGRGAHCRDAPSTRTIAWPGFLANEVGHVTVPAGAAARRRYLARFGRATICLRPPPAPAVAWFGLAVSTGGARAMSCYITVTLLWRQCFTTVCIPDIIMSL